MNIEDYYTEEEASSKIKDLEDFREYVHGLKDAIVENPSGERYYLKKDVDRYVHR